MPIRSLKSSIGSRRHFGESPKNIMIKKKSIFAINQKTKKQSTEMCKTLFPLIGSKWKIQMITSVDRESLIKLGTLLWLKTFWQIRIKKRSSLV